MQKGSNIVFEKALPLQNLIKNNGNSTTFHLPHWTNKLHIPKEKITFTSIHLRNNNLVYLYHCNHRNKFIFQSVQLYI